MNLDIWTALLLFGAIHGAFLSAVFLFARRGDRLANRFLALLLLTFTFHIVEYLSLACGVVAAYPHLLGTTSPLLFVVGPAFYFFARSTWRERQSLRWPDLLHLLPALLATTTFLSLYEAPAAYKVSLVKAMLSGQHFEVPLKMLAIWGGNILQLVIYLILVYNMAMRDARASETQNERRRWFLGIEYFFALYILGYTIAYGYLWIVGAHSVYIDYATVLTLSLCISAIGYYAILKPEVFPHLQTFQQRSKYAKSTLSRGQRQCLLSKLRHLMEVEELFLDPDLRLPDLARKLGTSTHHLSQMINQELNQNFFDLVNAYRISAAQQRMLQPENRHFTLLAIAMDVGFNNKASFNRAFKKHAGKTPSQFLREHKAPVKDSLATVR